MDDNEIKYFIEAAMLAAGRPLSVERLQSLFDGRSTPDRARIRQAIDGLVEDYEHRGITVSEVASGFRIQVKSGMAGRLQKLWEERSPRYSRALFETLALIAYRQPMTRGEIEEVRGVSVSANIVRSLLEREWIRVVGHRDVPGRPAMFGTTKSFLDYFGLKKLDDLPPLADLADWESLRIQLDLPAVDDDLSPELMAEVTALPAMTSEGGGPDAADVAEATTGIESAADASGQPAGDAESSNPYVQSGLPQAEQAVPPGEAAEDQGDVDASLTGG